MHSLRTIVLLTTAGLLLAVPVATASAQPGRGPGFRGGRNDPEFRADQEDFRFLLDHHKEIRRTVKQRSDGVESLTESDRPEVADRIRKHVAAMYERVEDDRPIRRRDPLFDELFRHADRIKLRMKKTDKGIQVIETSDDPYVVRLIQEHAKVLSLFVKHGHAEARKDHAVPKK